MKRRHEAPRGLPEGWERRLASVYIDHNTKATQWSDPRGSPAAAALFAPFTVRALLRRLHGLYALALTLLLCLGAGAHFNFAKPKSGVLRTLGALPPRPPVPRRPGLDAADFFREFVAESQAVLLPDAAAQWPALANWTDAQLATAAGDDVLTSRAGPAPRPTALAACLTAGALCDGPLPHALRAGVAVPVAAALLGDAPTMTLTVGGPGGGGGRPQYATQETVLCCVAGAYRVCLAGPLSSAGVGDLHVEDAGAECVTLRPGEGLYVPAYWWAQVRQGPRRAVAVAMAFPVHHALLERIYVAAGQGLA